LRTSRKGNEKYGTDQVLWLLHDYVTEVGTMNFFVFWKNEQGENELITPPLDGTILPGVTRDSILTLCKELGEFKVSVKPFKIQELMNACKEKRVYEAFGAGTAAIVSPVKSFIYDEETYQIPIDEEKGAGKLSQRILQMMTDLQYGKVSRPAWQFYI
jgi:branched-chain amino acid aminotransferase